MVIRLIVIFLLFPVILFSGEFTASTSNNQVQEGESFTLSLTLRSASPKGAPSIDFLKNVFFIHSQQQSYSTVILNGQASSSTTWKFILVPQKEGEVIIPSISIETSNGILSTNPLPIQVTKRAPTTKAAPSDPYGISVTANVTSRNPYKNEPVIYTLQLISKKDLMNLRVDKLNIENAIIEMDDEGKTYQKIVDGMMMNFIEVNYLITPLKAGPLEIPSIIIQGGIPIRNKASFFDDNHSLFSMMQGFDRLKPFVLETEKFVLNVQPVVTGINPWIPAKALSIEEVWDESQSFQEGAPLTRSFKIVAEGIKANQLPSLNDQQIDDMPFKIYADQPKIEEEIKDGTINSSRKEHYTLIPQEAGTLILPEISIAWWDVIKNEKKMAKIPARTLQIKPALTDSLKNEMTPTEAPEKDSTKQLIAVQRDPILYGLIAGLAVLLLIALFWGIQLQKKISKLSNPSEVKKGDDLPKKSQPIVKKPSNEKAPPKDKNEKLPDLNPT